MARFFEGFLLLFALVAFANGMSRVRRLVGGIEGDTYQFPYVAAIKQNNRLKCGATIISPTKILTSSACVRSCLVNDHCKDVLTVVTGSTNLEKDGNINHIKSVKIHSKYVKTDDADTGIAIITLESAVQLSERVKVIDLPNEDVVPNTTASSSGYGSTRRYEYKTSWTLNTINETIITNKNCAQFYLALDDNDLCAVAVDGADKAGLCIGDGGNALVQDGKLIGVATYGIECAQGYPDVFANVYQLLDFIKHELE